MFFPKIQIVPTWALFKFSHKTMSKNKNQIILNNYQTLLENIQKEIRKAGEAIAATTLRQKVVMSWQIGKIISENLSQNNGSGYGEKLFDQLEKDLLIKKRALYKIQNFYKAYPKLPKDEANLNWSHYRVLAEIKNDEKRKYLEGMVIEKNWSVQELDWEVRNQTEEKPVRTPTKKPPKNPIPKKLTPLRGQLFSYPVERFEEKFYLDLGFNIFKEIEEGLPESLQTAKEENLAIEVEKKNKKYSFQKSDSHPRKFNTYKAYLEKVVDGDTLRLTIDLGFKILHKEIIRLKAIDAPESETVGGKKSTKFLTNLLKNYSFLIIKTIKTDIYGRFVADVFLPQNADVDDAQKVADEGIYLNQMLLDEGMVGILD